MKQVITRKRTVNPSAKVCKRCKVRADIAKSVTGEGLVNGLCKGCRQYEKEMALQKKKKKNPQIRDGEPKPKFRLGDKVYSYWNKTTHGSIGQMRYDGDGYGWNYAINHPEHGRRWISEKSLRRSKIVTKRNPSRSYLVYSIDKYNQKSGGMNMDAPNAAGAIAKVKSYIRQKFGEGTLRDLKGWRAVRNPKGATVAAIKAAAKNPAKLTTDEIKVIRAVGPQRLGSPFAAGISDTKRERIINSLKRKGLITGSGSLTSEGYAAAAKLVIKKNSTVSDYKRYTKSKLHELGKRFQGVHNGQKHRLLESDYTPNQKYRLGHLVQMKIKANGATVPLNFDGDSMLSADLKNNLWVVGKDARINPANLRRYGITPPAKGEMSYLGKLVQIDYVTAKRHIENGETVRFYHKPGEVTKELPSVFVDHDGFPQIIGGGYDIWDVGIVN